MSNGTIILVHGTGVRLESYSKTHTYASDVARRCGVIQPIVPCAWGDPLGIDFAGKSLPVSPSEETLKKEQEDFVQWNWLFDDPLFELNALTIRDTSQVPKKVQRPDKEPEWLLLWKKIQAYQPSDEFSLLLIKGHFEELWTDVWKSIVGMSPIVPKAFEASEHELPDVCRALARSLIAELHVVATDENLSGPSRSMRKALVDRLLTDWDQKVYGLGTFFFNLTKGAATWALRRNRARINEIAAFPLGDILLYQAHGTKIRSFIARKIEEASPPVTLIAHSLGGIACFDLVALERPTAVKNLVTIGSQAPFFYEIGALQSLTIGQELPDDFPRWLNFYDRSDFLSFVAKPLFEDAKDIEIDSGQPFPDSHSAYFGNTSLWNTIREFI